MRLLFLGASDLTVMTAEALIEGGHSVIIIERDEHRIKELSERLDCAFLHGDGSRPAILEEAEPNSVDILFCITRDEQTNIVASLAAKSLGVGRVVTIIEDEQLAPICEGVGLTDTFVPTRTVSRHLASFAQAKADGEESV